MKHPSDPLVSVIISTYNRPEFLDRALASVCAQDFADFDVWVVDDYSDDMEAIGAVIEKWTAKFAERNIDLWGLRTPFNSGYQSYPKNMGIMQSSGELIAYLDDDNVWLPNHLSDLVTAFLAADTDMVYGGRRYVNNTDLDLPSGDVAAEAWSAPRLRAANYIDTSDILHSRGGAWMLAATTGSIWDENLTRYGDWDLLMRWSRIGLTATPVPGIHSEYHWHGDNLQLTRPLKNAPTAMPLGQYRAYKELDKCG
jgi:glycosyltransferase involved in cell wall biosynthesis